MAALAFGALLLLIGLAGFIPGLTSNMGTIALAGYESRARLVGMFQVSILLNVVHLVYGVAGVGASRSYRGSRLYFLAGGAAFILLAVYGLLVGQRSPFNVVPVNLADDGLHLALGVLMLAAVLYLGRRPTSRP